MEILVLKCIQKHAHFVAETHDSDLIGRIYLSKNQIFTAHMIAEFSKDEILQFCQLLPFLSHPVYKKCSLLDTDHRRHYCALKHDKSGEFCTGVVIQRVDGELSSICCHLVASFCPQISKEGKETQGFQYICSKQLHKYQRLIWFCLVFVDV